jgi:hypothetical protein
VTSLRDDLVQFFADPGPSGNKTFVDYTFREVDDELNWMVNTMQSSRHGWILLIETMRHQNRYVQAVVEPTGALGAECVSNEHLAQENRLNNEQCELLAKLGWEWPSPGLENWQYNDESLKAGAAVGGLMSRTIRRVFEVTDSENLRLTVASNE